MDPEQKTEIQSVLSTLYPESLYPLRDFPDKEKILIRAWQDLSHQEAPANQVLLPATHLSLNELLARKPDAVVLLFRAFIERLVRKKCFDSTLHDDLIQEIITRLLADKIHKIKGSFDPSRPGAPSFTSYFLVIMRNTYYDIVRESKYRRMDSLDQPDEIAAERNDDADIHRVIIQDEVRHFDHVLRAFGAARYKIALCLKWKYRIPVHKEDVKMYLPSCTASDLRILTRDFRKQNDLELFETVLNVLNKYENTNSKSDSLRKWIDVKINDTVRHMNLFHGRSVYKNIHIEDLVILYFQHHNKNV